MEFRRELVGATTAPLILAVLAEGPAHGYAVVRSVNELSDGLFNWREGTIYPALHRLEKAGLIRGAWEKTPGGRRRRVYSLTPRGKRRLSERRAEWKVFSGVVSRIMEACHAPG